MLWVKTTHLNLLHSAFLVYKKRVQFRLRGICFLWTTYLQLHTGIQARTLHCTGYMTAFSLTLMIATPCRGTKTQSLDRALFLYVNFKTRLDFSNRAQVVLYKKHSQLEVCYFLICDFRLVANIFKLYCKE